MLAHFIIYAMLGLVVVGALVTISVIGKPRGPVTPGLAVYVTIVSALQVSGLFHLLTQI